MESDDSWLRLSACRGKDVNPEWFFPERGQSHKPGKSVCAGCPVIFECRSYQERTDTEYGMWAGKIVPRKKSADIDGDVSQSA
jgi:WhiB family redox-sensing transcriptional regulator